MASSREFSDQRRLNVQVQVLPPTNKFSDHEYKMSLKEIGLVECLRSYVFVSASPRCWKLGCLQTRWHAGWYDYEFLLSSSLKLSLTGSITTHKSLIIFFSPSSGE
jgi:hypothetical protein